MDPGTRALIPRVAQGVLFLVPVGSGMRVLIAYDALPSSERALEEVLRRPWPEGTQVHLVTVVDRAYSPAQPPRDAIDSLLAEKYRSSLREETYHRVQGAIERFAARPDLVLTYEIRDGNVKQALLDAIRAWEPDLVVAGSHGAGPLTRFLLGSVSHALVTHAPCS